MTKKRINWKTGSYAKIFNLLISIPEFKDLYLLARERLENVEIDSVKYSKDWYDRPNVVVKLKLGLGDNAILKDISIDKDREFYPALNLVSEIFTHETLNTFVTAHFGVENGKKTPVPTFNCSLAQSFEFFIETLGSRADSLPDFMTVPKAMLGDLQNLNTQTLAKITTLISKLIASPKYSEGCQRASKLFRHDDGRREWFLNGKKHREDGPAVEYTDGNRFWFLNGKIHREDGPAWEEPDGTRKWYLNGELHREDGPAWEEPDGYREWWFKGRRLKVSSLEEFTTEIRLLQIQEVQES